MAAKEIKFECDICKKSFASKRYMNNHKITHSGSSKFTCSICGKLFTSTGNLNRHEKVHTGDKPYECDFCGTRFTEKCSLSKHMIKHTNDTRFQCEICDKIFTQKGHLDRHRRTHTRVCPFECNECGKKFKERSFLRVHSKIHSGELPFQCLLCFKRFLHKGSWKRHTVRKHTKPKPRECARCGEVFPSPTLYMEHRRINGENLCFCLMCKKLCRSLCRLNIHMKTHSKGKLFSCLLCEELFPCKKKLLGHLAFHTDKPYMCAECGENFKSTYDLKIHTVTHTGEELLHCADCGKAYLNKDSLLYHRKTHRTERRFHCPICEKTFIQSRNRERHVQTHMKEGCYPCAECGEVYDDIKSLKNHKEIHEFGEFNCIHCDKVFYRKSSLVSHVRMHAAVKKYPCSQCDKKFITIKGLDLHILTHTGEKPYRCPVCGKGCARGSGLKRHMKVHSGDAGFPLENIEMDEQREIFHCQECGKSFFSQKSVKLHQLSHAKGKITCLVCGEEFREKRAWRNHLSIHSAVNEDLSTGDNDSSLPQDETQEFVTIKCEKESSVNDEGGVSDVSNEFVGETVFLKDDDSFDSQWSNQSKDNLADSDSSEQSESESNALQGHSIFGDIKQEHESLDCVKPLEQVKNESISFPNVANNVLEPEILLNIKQENNSDESVEDEENASEHVGVEQNI